MNNRFDLEQAILSCWNIVEDIETIYHTDRLYSDTDEMMNALLGLKTIYHLKFEKLFEVFEEVVVSRAKVTDSNYDNHMGKQG